MASIPEKGVFLSRSLAYIFAISVLFLILSSSLLFQFGDNSLVPRSIYNLIIVNNTPDYIQIDEISDQFEPESPLSPYNESYIRSPASCDRNQALVKVFMYDLPPSFHFGLLGWKGDQNPNQIWPNVSNLSEIPKYPGGLNLQHSVEYWLTLDLLSSVSPHASRPCTAIRVQNASQADVIFVPFFSSLSYNRRSKVHGSEKESMDKSLQESLVKYLESRDEWRRLGGKDHLIMAHHPNSMLLARKHFGSSMLLLADFGRYPVQIANVDKDVIAPYKHVVRRLDANDSPSFEERRLLVYFQGAIFRKDGGIIRRKLYHLIKDEKDVHFTYGSASSAGIRTASRGMISSKFCLTIAGDTPSSNRLFDAIASHCVPVIISDDIELPFEDVLDYSKFAIFVQSSDAVKKGYLMKLLRGIKRQKWIQMWERLKKIAPHFEYQYPSQAGDAVNMIWQAVHRKICWAHENGVRRRRNRYRMSQRTLNS
ncbi:putative xylogalacturonan beta-1,3-xylosyltransferase [Helianthus annuus]|nr:putative xylogalacturonan beta-1,3-xylosyltransferase [Helianthus annuus]KAJ0777021.1 putative xylogalacturonan beta-1,3-xylosyltransferase [Helianthus annuus]KAJ0939667.1 putative xylogalacturonan beta-1,3-xylosyltransferase [Helianthus annuus]